MLNNANSETRCVDWHKFDIETLSLDNTFISYPKCLTYNRGSNENAPLFNMLLMVDKLFVSFVSIFIKN